MRGLRAEGPPRRRVVVSSVALHGSTELYSLEVARFALRRRRARFGLPAATRSSGVAAAAVAAAGGRSLPVKSVRETRYARPRRSHAYPADGRRLL